MRATRPVIALATLMAVVSACGGGSDDSADTTVAVSTTEPAPTTTEPAPTTTEAAPTTTEAAPPTTEAASPTTVAAPPTTVAQPQTEQEWAATALLTTADFDATWTQSPPEPDDEDDARLEQDLAECAGVDLFLLSDQVLGESRAQSGELSDADGVFSAEQSIGYAPDEATALAAMTGVADPDIPDCYVTATTDSFARDAASGDPADTLPAGVTLGEITFERFPLDGVPEDSAIWYQGTITLESEGETFVQHAELIFLRQGRVLSTLTLIGNNEAFPTDAAANLADLVLQRATAISSV
jgi:hypothetical protein